jgi:hypothetical protein
LVSGEGFPKSKKLNSQLSIGLGGESGRIGPISLTQSAYMGNSLFFFAPILDKIFLAFSSNSTGFLPFSSISIGTLAGRAAGSTLAETDKAFGEAGTVACVEFAMATAASASMPTPGACKSELRNNQYFRSQKTIHVNHPVSTFIIIL